jgi:hypothetical protein
VEQYPDAWFYHEGKGILIENEPETEFDSLGNLYIRGTATNTTDKDYSYVQLSWAVYDGSDAKIADGLANTAGLDAGQRWRFEALAPGAEDGESYELTEVSAY